MIWNARKPIEKTVDGVTWTLKPLTAMEQAEVLDLVYSAKTTKAIVEASCAALDYAFVSVAGLRGVDGQEAPQPTRSAEGKLERDWLGGFTVKTLTDLSSVIAHLGDLDEDVKKKS